MEVISQFTHHEYIVRKTLCKIIGFTLNTLIPDYSDNTQVIIWQIKYLKLTVHININSIRDTCDG